jgi:hypothetical protein
VITSDGFIGLFNLNGQEILKLIQFRNCLIKLLVMHNMRRLGHFSLKEEVNSGDSYENMEWGGLSDGDADAECIYGSGFTVITTNTKTRFAV